MEQENTSQQSHPDTHHSHSPQNNESQDEINSSQLSCSSQLSSSFSSQNEDATSLAADKIPFTLIEDATVINHKRLKAKNPDSMNLMYATGVLSDRSKSSIKFRYIHVLQRLPTEQQDLIRYLSEKHPYQVIKTKKVDAKSSTITLFLSVDENGINQQKKLYEVIEKVKEEYVEEQKKQGVDCLDPLECLFGKEGASQLEQHGKLATLRSIFPGNDNDIKGSCNTRIVAITSNRVLRFDLDEDEVVYSVSIK